MSCKALTHTPLTPSLIYKIQVSWTDSFIKYATVHSVQDAEDFAVTKCWALNVTKSLPICSNKRELPELYRVLQLLTLFILQHICVLLMDNHAAETAALAVTDRQTQLALRRVYTISSENTNLPVPLYRGPKLYFALSFRKFQLISTTTPGGADTVPQGVTRPTVKLCNYAGCLQTSISFYNKNLYSGICNPFELLIISLKW
jgi:hypothetical protein